MVHSPRFSIGSILSISHLAKRKKTIPPRGASAFLHLEVPLHISCGLLVHAITNNKDAVDDLEEAHVLILVQDAAIKISHLLGDPASPLHLVHPAAVDLEH
jgi:hypothetical protein